MTSKNFKADFKDAALQVVKVSKTNLKLYNNVVFFCCFFLNTYYSINSKKSFCVLSVAQFSI